MIKKLLTWYPDAATVPFQLMKFANDKTAATVPHSDQSENKIRSRSPFLQAIAFGMTWWHTVNTANCNEEDHNDDYMGLVQLLWRLNAGQITSNRDEVSGLYPFMLAAATATTTVDDCRNDTLMVDTTYNLLKKDPELLAATGQPIEQTALLPVNIILSSSPFDFSGFHASDVGGEKIDSA
eukprot:scaffold18371_cov78-Skeletonema_dohrnii-CCMP3373.AAC.1